MLKDYPDVMNIDQMCEILGVSTKTGYKLLKNGDMTFIKIGRNYRIPKAHISAQITAEAVQTNSESSYANESDTAQKAVAKQILIQQYYEAARSGDSEAAKRIAEQLKQF